MPHRDAPPLTRGVVLRGFGLAFAVALGGLAAWLIVTSESQKRLELGVLAGLWAALFAAFAMFGSRRFMHPLDVAYDGEMTASSAEIALRARNTDLERAEDAAARRAHEARLEHLLRNEIRVAINREVGALRAEVAELRSELLEKVGGQLRLERIETTRVIGSDLEALQHEVRQLKAVAAAQEAADLGLSRLRAPEPVPMRQVVEPARIRPVNRETAEVEADVQPARTPLEPEPFRPAAAAPPAPPPPAAPPSPAPPPSPVAVPAPPPPTPSFTPESTGPLGRGTLPFERSSLPSAPPPAMSPTPAQLPTTPLTAPEPTPFAPATTFTPAPPPRPTPPVAEPRPQPVPEPAPPAAPAPARGSFDELAALPRIRPFTDFELDPIEDEPAYTGRRRAEDQRLANGRHAEAEETGRRHRRADADDAGNELLAKLIAREGTR
jgi:hypothetical protein